MRAKVGALLSCLQYVYRFLIELTRVTLCSEIETSDTDVIVSVIFSTIDSSPFLSLPQTYVLLVSGTYWCDEKILDHPKIPSIFLHILLRV